MSTEPFTVPEAGSTYYVATPARTQRRMSIAAALPIPVNLFREYKIEAGPSGCAPAASPDRPAIDGTTHYGFGLDTGFTIDGAPGGGTICSRPIRSSSRRR